MCGLRLLVIQSVVLEVQTAFDEVVACHIYSKVPFSVVGTSIGALDSLQRLSAWEKIDCILIPMRPL
jgi:hypothetical protein